VKRKFNVFIDNYRDTNKPTILKISWKPDIKLHNSVILKLSGLNEWYKLTTNKEIKYHIIVAAAWHSNEQARLRFQKVGPSHPDPPLTLTTAHSCLQMDGYWLNVKPRPLITSPDTLRLDHDSLNNNTFRFFFTLQSTRARDDTINNSLNYFQTHQLAASLHTNNGECTVIRNCTHNC